MARESARCNTGEVTADASNDSVYFLTRMPPRLSVHAEILGSVWEVGGHDRLPVRLKLPRPAEGARPSALAAPVVADAASDYVERLRGDDPWGTAWVFGEDGEPLEAYINLSVVEFDVPAQLSTDARRQLSRGGADVMDRWLHGFVDWLEVFGGIHWVDRPTEHTWFVNLAVDRRSDSAGWLNPYDVLHAGTYIEPLSVSQGTWSDAVERTNADKEPGIDHLILRDARSALLTADYRKASVDASTALEVALAGAARNRLGDDAPTASVERLLKGVNGLMGLIDLVEALQIDVPVSRSMVQKRVAEPRNGVVHLGEAPTEAPVRAAIEVAQQVLLALSPLE